MLSNQEKGEGFKFMLTNIADNFKKTYLIKVIGLLTLLIDVVFIMMLQGIALHVLFLS